MKHIVVFGGTGKRGSCLCRKLLAEGNRVTCMDDDSVGWVCEIADCLDNENFRFIHSKVENVEPNDFKEKVDLIYDYTPSTINSEGKNLIKQLAKTHKCRIIGKMDQISVQKRGGR